MKLEQINALWSQILDITDEFTTYGSYSGRGMFGKRSAVAFTTIFSPQSDTGKRLISLGLCCDNMGFDYVYYTKEGVDLT